MQTSDPQNGKQPENQKQPEKQPEKQSEQQTEQQPENQKQPEQAAAPAGFQSARRFRFLPLYCSLLAAAVLTLWFSQQSVNAYWQQTFHRSSPLEKLDAYPWWQRGAQLQNEANDGYRGLLEWIDSQNGRWQQQFPAADNTPLADAGSDAPPQYPSAFPPLDDDAASGLPAVIRKTETAGQSASAPQAQEQKQSEKQPEDPQSATVTLKPGDKVFFAGDSLMQGVAPHVRKSLHARYGVESIDLSKQSTGLSYPGFFDRPAVIEKNLKEQPDIRLLVVFFGPNDPWDFPDPEKKRSGYLRFKSPEWEAVYRSRIRRIADAAEQRHVRLIWLGIPLMKPNKLNDQTRYLDRVLASELSGRALWLPTDELLGGRSAYRDSISLDGRNVRMRSKDGIDFTNPGQQRLAAYIERHIAFTGSNGAQP